MATQALIRSINDYVDADVALEWRLLAGADAAGQVQRAERARRRLQRQLSEALPSDASLVQPVETYLNAHLADPMTGPDHLAIERARRNLIERLAGPSEPHPRSPGEARSRPLTRRILLAVDDSPPSQWATDVAGGLAQFLDAHVMVIHVIEATEREAIYGVDDIVERRRRDGAALLNRAQQSLPPTVDSDQMLREGTSSEQIAAAARMWEADLIVMGTRGRSRFATFVLGSTAEAVVRGALCPVLTVGHEPERFIGRPTDRSVEAVR